MVYLMWYVCLASSQNIEKILNQDTDYISKIDLRYLVLFLEKITKLSAFCLKQVQVSASGVSKILLF